MTSGSSMQAMTFMAPLQAGQVSISILNTRLSHCAHVIAMDGMYAGFAGAKTGHGGVALGRGSVLCLVGGLAALAAPGRCNQRSMFAVGCEHTVETREVDTGPGHQGSETGDEIQRVVLCR